MDHLDCQTADLLSPSKKYPRVFTMFRQLRNNLRELGFLATCRKAWRKVFSSTATVGPQAVGQPAEYIAATEVLGLQPGELVEVKSEEEIRQTLDSTGKNRGLGFMPEMWSYCGQRRRVFRRVEKICLENAPRTVRAMKNTVLLENAVCQGSGIGCDRACFYFWRECWLKRVPAPAASDLNVLNN